MSYDDKMTAIGSVRSVRLRYYAITFLVWFSTALPLSTTILLAQARGLSLFETSTALGLYSLTVVLLEVPTGGLADAAGRRRVALVAFALAAVYSVVLLFTFSFPTLLLAMLLYGASRALSSGALDAWFVDALQTADPRVDLQAALAGAETVALLALGLGALAGGALPRLFAHLPADGAVVLTPLATPIVASLLVRLLTVAAIALLIREQRPGGASWRAGFRAVPAITREAVTLSRANPRLLLLMAASFAGGMAVISLEALWQPFFAALPWSGHESAPTPLLGVLMAGSFVAGMGGNLLSVPLSRRLNERHALVSAIASFMKGVAMMALAGAGALLPAAGFFWLVYLMGGVGLSPHATLLNAEIPAARRSAMLSVQSLAAYLGSFVGGTGLGYIAENISIPAAWLIAGALTVVSLTAYLLLDARRDRRSGTARPNEQLLEQP